MQDKKSSISILLYNLKSMQNSRSNLFRIYEGYHKKIVSKYFKKSCVSMCFRLKLISKEEAYNRAKSNKNLLLNDYVLAKHKKNTNMYGAIKNLSLIQINEIKLLLQKEILNKNNKGVSINNVINFVNKLENNYNLSLKPEVILMQRTSSKNDRFSGQVSYPGGKSEKSDTSLLYTAVRETFEELGIQLLNGYFNLDCLNSKETDNNFFYPIQSRLILQNPFMDIPLGSNYIVFSFVFLLFDLFDELDNNIKPCSREVYSIMSIPLDYFLIINKNLDEVIAKIPYKINFCLFKEKFIKIEKLKLNNDNNCLLYGMTYRKLLRVLNYKNNIVYNLGFCKNQNKLLLFVLERFNSIFNNFILHPKIIYNCIKYALIAFIIYGSYITILSFSFQY